MLTGDAEFRVGDNITVLIKNRPFVDFLVPPDLNDYRPCDFTSIKIYDPQENLIIDDSLFETTNPGWYYYRYQTSVNSQQGLYKIVVELQTEVEVGQKTSPISTSSSGSSGSPTSELVSDVQIRFFRLSSREVF
jgi:hypothetical protein